MGTKTAILSMCLALGLGLVLAGCGASAPLDPQQQQVRQLMLQVRQGAPEQRRAAAEQLGQLKATNALAALLPAMSDSQLAVRLAAITALGQIGEPAAVPGLVSLLGDGHPQVRKSVADALGAIGAPTALEPLLARLQDEQLIVRYSASAALGRLGPTVLPALLDKLQKGTAAERAGVLLALGGLRQPAATEAILGALGDPDLNVRRQAIEALGLSHDDRAVPALTALLDEPISAQDRARLRAANQGQLSAQLLEQTGRVLLERAIAQATPTSGSYPHQADKLRAKIGQEIARLATLVSPPLDPPKLAALTTIITDRIGPEAFAALNESQRATALRNELRHLETLVKPPRDSAKEEIIGQILARRTARAWWDTLGPKGQENAVRQELARRVEDHLNQQQLQMRQAAANALGSLGSAAALNALVNALGGPSRHAQEMAQASLQTLGPAALAPLTQVVLATNFPATTRHRSLEIICGNFDLASASPETRPAKLVAAAPGERIAALLLVLEQGAPEHQLVAAKRLAELGSAAPEIVKPLVAALNSPVTDVRRIAARALGQLGDKSAADPLLKALQDDSLQVRVAAIVSLAQLEDPRAVTPALALLRQTLTAAEEELALPLVRALGRLKARTALELLVPLLKSDRKQRELASAAAEALGDIGDPRAVEPLIELLLSNHWGPCFAAATALGQIGDVRAVEALAARATAKSYPEFPPVTLPALGRIPDAKATQALLGVLQAPDHATHKLAAEALVAQGATAVPLLVQILGGTDQRLRGVAAQILGYIGLPALPALLEYLAQPGPTPGTAGAIYALSSIRDPRVIPPLVQLLQHTQADLRANAAWALGFSPTPAVRDALAAVAQNDADPKVQAAAASALQRVESDLANAARN